MRKLLLFLAVLGAVIWMFTHQDETKTHSQALLGKLSKVLKSWSGEKDEPPPPPEPPKELPEGMYCLTQPVRFWFSNGTNSQPAGALVRKTGDGGNGKIMVTDEVGTAMVEARVLTRDPVLVDRLSGQGNANSKKRSAAELQAMAQELQAIESKLMSLRGELLSIKERDAAWAKVGRKVNFATTESFVRSTITTLEKKRDDILAIQRANTPPPPPPVEPPK